MSYGHVNMLACQWCCHAAHYALTMLLENTVALLRSGIDEVAHDTDKCLSWHKSTQEQCKCACVPE